MTLGASASLWFSPVDAHGPTCAHPCHIHATIHDVHVLSTPPARHARHILTHPHADGHRAARWSITHAIFSRVWASARRILTCLGIHTPHPHAAGHRAARWSITHAISSRAWAGGGRGGSVGVGWGLATRAMPAMGALRRRLPAGSRVWDGGAGWGQGVEGRELNQGRWERRARADNAVKPDNARLR